LLLSFIVAVQHGNPLGTSRTLWIGDSTVLLAPVEGVKIGFPGASIAQLQQALSHAMQSRDDYDQVIVMVVGQLYYGRSYASLMVDLNRLAIDIEENIGVRPLVIDPKVIRDLVRVEKFSYDNKHLTTEGYRKLFAHIRERIKDQPHDTRPHLYTGPIHE